MRSVLVGPMHASKMLDVPVSLFDFGLLVVSSDSRFYCSSERYTFTVLMTVRLGMNWSFAVMLYPMMTVQCSFYIFVR